MQSTGCLLLRGCVTRSFDETDVDFIEPVATADLCEQSVGQPSRLAFLVEAGEYEAHSIAVAPVEVDAHLGGGRCRLADGAADAHAVRPVLRELNGVETADHIGIGIRRRADFVEQLRCDGSDGDDAAGASVLGDDTRTVGRHFCDREAERTSRLRDLLEP